MKKTTAQAAFLTEQLQSRVKRLLGLGMEEGLNELFYRVNIAEVRVIIGSLQEMTNVQFNIFFDLITEEIKVLKRQTIKP